MTVNQRSLRAFQNKVQKFAATLPAEKLTIFHRRLALEALGRLVAKTPVDTGRARGGWIVSTGEPSLWMPGEEEVVPPEVVQAKGEKALGSLLPFDIVFVSNNVEYIEALERGHSKQAPHGMLAETVAELSVLFLDAA